jgi:hypothetical protein
MMEMLARSNALSKRQRRHHGADRDQATPMHDKHTPSAQAQRKNRSANDHPTSPEFVAHKFRSLHLLRASRSSTGQGGNKSGTAQANGSNVQRPLAFPNVHHGQI